MLGSAAAGWWEWWSVYPVPHVTSIDVLTNSGKARAAISTDGSRVYYEEIEKNRFMLTQVSSRGGETSIVPTPLTAPVLLDIAPDHSSLLVADWGASSSLWMVPLPQGPSRRVGDVIADDATFTPDGKQIIFTNGAEVWISDADGSQRRKLWTSPGSPIGASALRVSPDGKRLRLGRATNRSVLCGS